LKKEKEKEKEKEKMVYGEVSRKVLNPSQIIRCFLHQT
jgi:hypothetical protein